jgi:GT2 family glycosyltransferase
MSVPTVSVVILTHNRKDLLQQSLRSVLQLAWPELEVIVVDNVSTDGTPEMIEQEFGSSVRVIRRTVDLPTAGRNEGFRSAKGDFILSLDNDMIVSDTFAIHKAVALFEQFPKVGLITVRIAGVEAPDTPLREHWWHNQPFETGKNRFFYTDYFSEGALFMRASTFRDTGGYDDDFFYCFESIDLALRILSAGYDMLYAPTIGTVELQVGRSQHKTRSERNYYFLRNKIWVAWKNYSPLSAIAFVGPRIVKDGLRSARYKWLDLWFRAVKEGIFAPRVIRRKRKPLPPSSWRRIQEARKCHILEMNEMAPDAEKSQDLRHDVDGTVGAGADLGQAAID